MKLITSICMSLICTSLLGQDLCVELESSVGTSGIYQIEYFESNRYRIKHNASSFSVGTNFRGGLETIDLSASTGVHLLTIKNDIYDLKFIEIPFEIKYQYGNKFKGIVGFGGYFKRMLNSSLSENNIDFDQNKNEGITGYSFRAGIAYQIKPTLELGLSLKIKNDFEYLHRFIHEPLPEFILGDQRELTFTEMYISERQISFSLRYFW